MINKFLIAIICFATYGLHAQNGTVSPYSYFGIGELRSAGTVENQMMGGLSVYTDSIHVNLQNPAAFGKLRITAYTGALSHKELRLKSFTDEQQVSKTNLEYLAMGFPVSSRMSVGFGLKPFSSVGYDLLSSRTNASDITVTNQYTGEGGINQAFLSAGFRLASDLHLGATVNVNFGKLLSQRIQTVENVQFGTLDDRESRVSGYDFIYGATYTPHLDSKHTLFTSVIIHTQANLVSENKQRIGSFSNTTGQEIEVVDVDLEARGLKNTELKIPTTTTLGLGYGEDKKWFLGAEYGFQALSSFTNEFANIDNLEYQDASRMAMGGFFIPDYSSFASYFKRVTYRAGIFMNKTGMVINNKEINNFGITFGLGMPLGIDFSNLNLGFELGRQGTTDADLIEESYLKINVGFSLNDGWFRKRQID